MSRGLGKLQTTLVGELQRLEAGGAVSENTLCWEVAEKAGGVETRGVLVTGISAGRIRPAFYKNFRRAVSGLYERGIARRTTRRKLITIGEVVACYPYRTLDVAIRTLRHVLLPHVLAFGTQAPRTSASAKIEERLLATLNPNLRQACGAAWAELRMEIVSLLAVSPSAAARDLLVRLLVKGMRYFDLDSSLNAQVVRPHGISLSDSASLSELLDAAFAGNVMPTGCVRRLADLYDTAIPRVRRAQDDVKDVIFRVGHFGQSGYHKGPRLKDGVKFELLKVATDLVSSLPGHEEPRRKKVVFWEEDVPPKFSPWLDKFIDRHIFDAYTFLETAGSTSLSTTDTAMPDGC